MAKAAVKRWMRCITPGVCTGGKPLVFCLSLVFCFVICYQFNKIFSGLLGRFPLRFTPRCHISWGETEKKTMSDSGCA